MTPGAPFTPLSAAQLRSLVDTSKRARKIRRAAAVARFGGWTGGVFAGLTLLGSLLSFSLAGIILGLGLGAVALGEFHGARLLHQLDPAAPRRLAANQMLFAVVLGGYFLWCLYTGPGELAANSGNPDVDAMVAGMVRPIYTAMYGLLLLVGVAAPMLTAWYYLSRAKLITELRASADSTVIEALKAA